MTKLELAIVDNYIEWMETPSKRKLKLKLISMRGKYLGKLWEKEHNCSKEQAQKEISKLLLNVVYGIKEEK